MRERLVLDQDIKSIEEKKIKSEFLMSLIKQGLPKEEIREFMAYHDSM
jgi:hypothetical protein